MKRLYLWTSRKNKFTFTFHFEVKSFSFSHGKPPQIVPSFRAINALVHSKLHRISPNPALTLHGSKICIAPLPRPPPWRNSRKARDQILLSGNRAPYILSEPFPHMSMKLCTHTVCRGKGRSRLTKSGCHE